MKTAVIAAVLALATGSLALGQGTPQADGETSTEQTLARIEREIADGAVKGDAGVFERYLADTYTLTTPDGSVTGKPPLLAELKSGDLKFTSSRLEELKVQIYGDAAVVTYASTDAGSDKGQDFGGRNRWTDVFIRRDGRWQQAASQGTPAPPKP
jgi:hypothetical protein